MLFKSDYKKKKKKISETIKTVYKIDYIIKKYKNI